MEIAIIGKPNVGKSTLFNRLIGKRVAITEKVAGVTRDNNKRALVWKNKSVNIWDTGGLFDDGVYSEHIYNKINELLKDINLVFFVIDGSRPLDKRDEAISNLLRKCGVTVWLVINKSDKISDASAYTDFYTLSFDNHYFISSAHGNGTGLLLDDVFNSETYLSQSKDIDRNFFRIIICGQPNAGKSSIFNILIKNELSIISEIPNTTRDSIAAQYMLPDQSIVEFVDTAGMKRPGKVKEKVVKYSVLRTLENLQKSDLALLVVDCTQGMTHQNLRILGYAEEHKVATVLVFNKFDLLEFSPKEKKEITDNFRRNYPNLVWMPVIFVSTFNVKSVSKITKLIMEIRENLNTKIPKNVLNRLVKKILFLQSAVNPANSTTISHGYQIDEKNRMKFLFFVRGRKEMHFSRKRFVENEMRKNLQIKNIPFIVKFKNSR